MHLGPEPPGSGRGTQLHLGGPGAPQGFQAPGTGRPPKEVQIEPSPTPNLFLLGPLAASWKAGLLN